MADEKRISKLNKIQGVVGIVGTETDYGIYYQEPVDWSVLREIIHPEEGTFVLRDVKHVESVLTDYLTDYPMGGVPHHLTEIHHLAELLNIDILWEDKSRKLTYFQKQLRVAEPKVKGKLLEDYLREAAYLMDKANSASARGDVHYMMTCFSQTVHCWNQLFYILNDHPVMSEDGAGKKISKFKLKPPYYLVRVEKTYNYFASHYYKLGFDEYKTLQNEIKQIVAQLC